jgi:hypothetical protein
MSVTLNVKCDNCGVELTNIFSIPNDWRYVWLARGEDSIGPALSGERFHVCRNCAYKDPKSVFQKLYAKLRGRSESP